MDVSRAPVVSETSRRLPEVSDDRARSVTRWRLLAASTLMLFLELALIRWLGAEVLHLSYFSNFVLLGSFLGVGLGFLRAAGPAHPDRPLPLYSPVVLLGLVGFVSAYPVTVDRSGAELIFFTSLGPNGPPIWLTLPAVFLAVAAVLAGPGELVGACFRQLPRLEAYRFDLLGSLVGIAAFTLLAFSDAPPLVWFVIVAVLFLVLLGRPALSVTLTLLVAMILLFGYPLRHDKGEFWSPYYRVDTKSINDPINGHAWDIQVNGVPHQLLVSAAVREGQNGYYTEPYNRVPRTPRNVLIVGAGTGTDVAVALRKGVQHLCRPAGHAPHQRRTGVPATDDDPLRPDPVRAPRLTHPGFGRELVAAGELSLHRTSRSNSPGAPRAGRCVRNVQLLPRALAG